MVDGKCHAVTHRVQIPDNYSRLAIASFYTQDPNAQFLNIINGKKIADAFSDYASSHLIKTFPLKEKAEISIARQ